MIMEDESELEEELDEDSGQYETEDNKESEEDVEEKQTVSVDLEDRTQPQAQPQIQQETQQIENGFSEFMLPESQEMPTLTLPSAEEGISNIPTINPVENLEQGAEEAPISPFAEETTERQEPSYKVAYNEPEYVGSQSEEEMMDNVRAGTMQRTVEQIRELRPRTMAMDPELEELRRHQERGGRTMRDYVIETGEKRDNKRKLPFEEKTKYKPMER